MKASRVGLNRLERHIQPPMSMAITIPLMEGGDDTGIVLYVATSAFGALGSRPNSADVARAATRIVDAINSVDINLDAFSSVNDMKGLSDERFAQLAGQYLAEDRVLDALCKAAPAAAPLVAALVDRLRRRDPIRPPGW